MAAERTRNRWWDRLLDPVHFARRVGAEVQPTWRRFTEGESRIPVTIAIGVAIALQLLLDDRVANHPKWVLPTLAFLLLVGIVAANPKRIDSQSRALRLATLLLIAIMSLANMASAARLILDLIRGEGIHDAGDLLLAGGAIWLTNVIVFALWYWMFDRGGPVARLLVTDSYPDLLFPQMTCDPALKLVQPRRASAVRVQPCPKRAATWPSTNTVLDLKSPKTLLKRPPRTVSLSSRRLRLTAPASAPTRLSTPTPTSR